MSKIPIIIGVLLGFVLGIGGFLFVSKKAEPPASPTINKEGRITGELPSTEIVPAPPPLESGETVSPKKSVATPLPPPPPPPPPPPSPTSISKPVSPPPSGASTQDASAKIKALNKTSNEFDTYNTSANQTNENIEL